MSWPTLLCVVLAAVFATLSLRALALDRADEYHLMHGPTSGCVECEGK